MEASSKSADGLLSSKKSWSPWHSWLALGQGMFVAGHAWHQFIHAWADVDRSPAHSWRGGGEMGMGVLELMTQYWDAQARAADRFLGAPTVGPTRELNLTLARSVKAWMECCRAACAHHVSMSQAWAHAGGEFTERFWTGIRRGESTPTSRQLLYLWLDVLDEAFTTLFRSPHYIERQSRFINAAMAYRVLEAELVETVLKTTHVASRGDVDEVSRRLHQLRREVRELKHMLRELRGHVSAAGAGGTEASSQPPA